MKLRPLFSGLGFWFRSTPEDSGGGATQSSLEDPDPEDSVEIRLSGRWPDAGGSDGSEGVADGARSSLLMEAMDRRGDSDDQTKKSQQKS